MLSRISKALTGRTLYDQFELIVSGIVLFLVSTVIVFTTILTTIELIRDFLTGIKFLDAEVFKDTFGLILILILLEFNHSIVSALRQRAGSIQVSIIVLITITVIARKLILLDYASATPETLLGLGVSHSPLGCFTGSSRASSGGGAPPRSSRNTVAESTQTEELSNARLPTVLARAVLGAQGLGFPLRVFRMRLGWPGQEGQARCIIDAEEDTVE